MKEYFKPERLIYLWTVLGVMLFVKIGWFVVEELFLPYSGIEYVQKQGAKPLYYRVRLNPNTAPPPVAVKPKPVVVTGGNINDIKLLALYNALEMSVITVEYKGKTQVLSRGDLINGFKVEGAGSNYATLTKGGKLYKIMLIISSKGTNSVKRSSLPTPVVKPKSKGAKGEIIDAGDRKLVDKSLVEHFAGNLAEVNKNIGISEVKDGANLKGFRISFIRQGSPFAQLGVLRGDVIKSINGQKIDSYNAAFSVYKSIGDIQNLSLVIERGTEEMELEYEVN